MGQVMCAKQEMGLPGNTFLITSTEMCTSCAVAFSIIARDDSHYGGTA